MRSLFLHLVRTGKGCVEPANQIEAEHARNCLRLVQLLALFVKMEVLFEYGEIRRVMRLSDESVIRSIQSELREWMGVLSVKAFLATAKIKILTT